jgi:methyl-accepting chemotaxis protein
MGDLTIKKQVIITSMIAIVIFIASTVYAALLTQDVKNKEKLRDLEILDQMAMKDARYHIVQIQQFLTDASLTGNNEAVGEALENKTAVLKIMEQFKQTNPHLTTQVNEIISLINQLYATGEKMMATYKASGQAAGNIIMTEANTGFDTRSAALSDKLETLATHVNEKEHHLQKELDVANSSLKTTNFVTSILQIILLIGLCALIFFRILPAILRLKSNIESLTTGDKDLSKRLTIRKQDELGEIAHSVNHFTAELDSMISAIHQAAMRLQQITRSFQKNSTQSAQGMLEVHTHTDLLATAINEMTSTVSEVARNTEQAAQIANTTRDTTLIGENVVKESIDIINTLASDIDESATQIQSLVNHSEKIGDIINVIKSISDQLNR